MDVFRNGGGFAGCVSANFTQCLPVYQDVCNEAISDTTPIVQELCSPKRKSTEPRLFLLIRVEEIIIDYELLLSTAYATFILCFLHKHGHRHHY